MNVGIRRKFDVSGTILAALIVFISIVVAYLVLLPESSQATFDSFVAEPILLAMLLVLFSVAAHRSDTANRKWFWRLISFSFGLWLIASLLGSALPDSGSPSLALLKDLLYLGHFCAIAAVVELRLDKGDGLRRAKQHTAAAIGSLLMFAAIFVYFGIAPLANSIGPYQTPYGLHSAFDAYLALRFLLAALQTENASWRFLFGGFAAVFSLIVAADLLALAFDLGIVEYVPGQPMVLLWYTWYPVAYLLTGTKLEHSAAEPRDDPANRLTVASRALLLFGLSLPFLHVSGYAIDALDIDARQARDFVVAMWILIITALLVVVYFMFRSKMRKLDLKSKQAAVRTRQVEQQLDRELRIRSLGRLSAGLAHDFGNTLTAVRLHAELIRNKLAHGVSVSEDIDGLDESIGYARRLLDKLAQFGNSQELLSISDLELNHEVRNTVEIIRHSLKSGVRLVLMDDPNEMLVSAERTMIHQVVSNYLHNAMDAVGEKGKIEVSIDSVDEYLRCASCGEDFSGRYARLAVRDSGPGVDSALAGQIFEPLISSKPVGVGSGLGLSTVHGVMHSIGGHVGLLEETDSGSCFVAYFPIAGGSG